MTRSDIKNSKYEVDVDSRACKECGYCIEVCPQYIFTHGTEFNDKGYKAVTTVDEEKCIGCLKCFYICPDFAINIKKKEDKANEKSI